MILFHGTDRDFDAFSSEYLHSASDRHQNGRLGVWVTTDPDLAGRFGKYVLAVETPGDRTFKIDMVKLREMGHDSDRDIYGEMRSILRQRQFDILAVMEFDGSSPTRAILDPEGCRIVGRVLAADNEALDRVRAMATEDNDWPSHLRF